MPACLSFEHLLVHTENLAVFVNNLRAYPDGVEFAVHVRRSRDAGLAHPPWLASPFERHAPFADGADGRGADRYLRFGVQYADGRRAQADRFHRLGSSMEPPLVTYGSGGGGEGRWDQDVWIWGLPQEGSITVVYSWLAENVPEASFVLDGQELRTAASRARVLWPESPDA
ncbi:hypothetical protein LN042_20445 [Kitasatospora sp. RB6PN24]|uniref:hypothetical protein n=1 Tax=Kitasatospora humi TaxID=2893891 RepID=UPI001E5DD59D|nr:hypothetical protein [Kitasatospora humi]MCC9309421.1 hypothetical protein [Kitasatospora humi]